MIRIKKIIEYVTILLVVIQCRSYIVHLAGYENVNGYMKMTIVGLIIMWLLLEKRTLKIKQNEVCLLCIYVFAMLMLCISNESYLSLGFISIFMLFIAFYILLCNDRYDRILELYTNIVFVICLISLFFFVFATCLHLIKPTGRFISDWDRGSMEPKNNYFYVYTEMQKITSFGYRGYRNTAIWTEGPMIAVNVIIALYYEVMISNKPRKYVIACLIITAITSFSTTAFLLIGVISVMFIMKKIEHNKLQLILITSIVTIIVCMFANIVISDKIINGISSYEGHMSHLQKCFECFLSNPICGVGFNNVRALDSFGMRTGLSTGLGAILAYGGILWGLWFIVPFMVAIKRYFTRRQTRDYYGIIIVYGILLFAVLIQDVALNLMMNAISWKIILCDNVTEKGFIKVSALNLDREYGLQEGIRK